MKRDDDDAISDEELTAAAVTLATLADGPPLSARLRERVEASGRRALGEKASEHARRRASDARAASTTSAGTQVIVATAESPPPRAHRFASYAWGAAAGFAAAAAVAFFVRSPRPAPAAAHDVERIPIGDANGTRGELRYDRVAGTGTLSLSQGAGGESLELWITFEGDAAPRAVALLSATSSDVDFALCRPVVGLACAPVQEVFVTREAPPGTLTFVTERTVLRGRGPR